MSLKVTVRFTGELRSLAGLASLQLSLGEGSTLGDAVLAAGSLASPGFLRQVAEPLLEDNSSAPLLLVNRALCSGAELNRPVGDGDIIAFVLPMEGG
jgi:molybdopterin converting factor small subunit